MGSNKSTLSTCQSPSSPSPHSMMSTLVLLHLYLACSPTKLFRKTPSSINLLDDEALPPILTGAGIIPKNLMMPIQVSSHQTPDPMLSCAHIPLPLPYPLTRKSPGPHCATSYASAVSDDSCTDSMSDTELTASTLSDLSDIFKISKPFDKLG